MITHGELFAGIGGFGVGMERAGIETKWHVEWDLSCQNVLRRHFPNVQIEGDVCDVGSHNLSPVDVISFGSPCQDLSIAGKRKGLENGTRSSLFFEAIRIVRELNPKVAIWENVPGALSSNGGQDFRAVLAEMLRADVPMPRSGRWATAGVVRSGEVEVAWRILDAQYFGVPQRRRRVFVVASFGIECAAEILFEPESLPRNTPPSRETREGIADTFKTRSGKEGGGKGYLGQESLAMTLGGQPQYLSQSVDILDDQGGSQMSISENIVPTLGASVQGHQPLIANWTSGGGKMDDDVAATLRAGAEHNSQFVWDMQSTVGALQARDGKGIGSTIDDKIITIPIHDKATRYKGGGDTRKDDGAGNGSQIGNEGDPMYTLGTSDKHMVAWEMQHASEAYRETQGGIAPTLQSRMGTGGNNVPLVGVRRLTPTECERLQGFSDGHTEWSINEKGDKVIQSDSARYKQLGNAVAVPVVEWIGKRVSEALA